MQWFIDMSFCKRFLLIETSERNHYWGVQAFVLKLTQPWCLEDTKWRYKISAANSHSSVISAGRLILVTASEISLTKFVKVSSYLGLDDRGVGVRVPVGARFFFSPRRPDRCWGPPSLLSNGYQGLFPRGKTVGAWSWHSPVRLRSVMLH
jgi:hypothetical protein